MLSAAVASAVLAAVVLFFAIYFFTPIFTLRDPGQVRQGWSDFTPEQLRTMGRRYGLNLIPAPLLV